MNAGIPLSAPYHDAHKRLEEFKRKKTNEVVKEEPPQAPMGTTTTSFMSHRQRASTGVRANTFTRRMGDEIVFMKKSVEWPTRSIEQSSGGGF